jgi:carotenoid 1,2-hydratase
MSLNLLTGTAADTFVLPSGNGAYEWWYFDAIDRENDLSLVAIFFRGIPFSGVRQKAALEASRAGTSDDGSRFPAVAFSLYGPSRTEAYCVNLHPPDALRIPADGKTVCIGASRACLAGEKYVIDLAEVLLDGRMLGGRLEFIFEPALAPSHHRENPVGHDWILAAPRCRFEGELRIGDRSIALRGAGYHDHNAGQSSLPSQFRSWEWGRAHFAQSTFVYYRSESHRGEIVARAIEIDPQGSMANSTTDFDVRRVARNIYRTPYPSEIVIDAPAGDRIVVEQSRIVDNGPFYIRFLSTFRRGRESVRGFSEVLRPRALEWRWFWPLLDSRVRPPGSRDIVGRKITSWLISKGF